jgi:hypothetical protein
MRAQALPLLFTILVYYTSHERCEEPFSFDRGGEAKNGDLIRVLLSFYSFLSALSLLHRSLKPSDRAPLPIQSFLVIINRPP